MDSLLGYDLFAIMDHFGTGGRWFNHRAPFRGLMIGHYDIFHSSVTAVRMWESSQWLGNNIVQSTGEKRTPRKAWIGALAVLI